MLNIILFANRGVLCAAFVWTGSFILAHCCESVRKTGLGVVVGLSPIFDAFVELITAETEIDCCPCCYGR